MIDPILYQEMVVEEIKKLESQRHNKLNRNQEEKEDPLVVAILVSPEGKTIKSYRDECCKGDHAEFNLFMNKLNGEDHSKDTLFVSLEPCNHDSRVSTKSCSELIVEHKIKTVYMGCFDPDIRVRGDGYLYLTDNGVDVKLFEEKYSKELIDHNKEFFRDRIKGDENYNRFFKFNEDSISKESAAFYLMSLNGKKYNEKAIDNYIKDHDVLRELYEDVTKKMYLYPDVKNNKRVISLEDGFSLAFYKTPCANFKGAYIRVIDNTEYESPSEKFNQSLLIAYQKAAEYIKSILKKITDNNKVEGIVRELLANAVFHKDYNSPAPIIVKIFNDKILISNPCVKEYVDEDALNNFKMPTNPVNGCITEIAIDMKLMEGQGRGEQDFSNYFKSVSKSDTKPYELICNILTVTIPILANE